MLGIATVAVLEVAFDIHHQVSCLLIGTRKSGGRRSGSENQGKSQRGDHGAEVRVGSSWKLI